MCGVRWPLTALRIATSPAVRVAFEDAERLPEILKAIPESEILRKQRNIRKVWRRYARRAGCGVLASSRVRAFFGNEVYLNLQLSLYDLLISEPRPGLAGLPGPPSIGNRKGSSK